MSLFRVLKNKSSHNQRSEASSYINIELKSVKGKVTHFREDGVEIDYSLKNETTIGRHSYGNDIELRSFKVSKNHAKIIKTNGKFELIDLNSSNGVYVNSEKVNGRRILNENDEIDIGREILVFHEVQQRDEKAKAPYRESMAINLKQRNNASDAMKPLNYYAASKPSRYSTYNMPPTHQEKYNSMVSFVQSDEESDKLTLVRASLNPVHTPEDDFLPVENLENIETLKADYEKLRLAYLLSNVSVVDNLDELLQKLLDLVFSVIKDIDRGVVLIVDREKSTLGIQSVKLREGFSENETKISLSITILQWVITKESSLIITDALQNPAKEFKAAQSISGGNIRSVICIPLIAHSKILGVLHLDSINRINAFNEKDVKLIKTICNQASIAIENSMLLNEVEKEVRIIEQLGRFLPPQVVDKMIENEELIHQEGREIIGTVLFADIRGFTNLSERSTPQEIVNLLNDYFERVRKDDFYHNLKLVEVVFNWNGVLDKYIGDALMAVFGTLDEEDPVRNSVGAALGIREAIRDMNADLIKNGKEPIGVGVGVNTGPLIAGFIGCTKRLEYTCIGDTVNTSSRICGVAQADQVLISESSYKYLKDQVNVKYVDKFQFKGKELEVSVYEVHELYDK